MTDWTARRRLGRSGLLVSRLGLGASFGIGGRDLEYAYDRGVNYFYWGSARRPGFGAGVRSLARRHRDDIVVVLQSYSRSALALRTSLEIGLRRLKLDYVDVLLLGMWNAAPPDRIVDAALVAREAGKVGHLMISCHHRPSFARYITDPCYDGIMVRYNAAHPGAERDVFPEIDRHVEPPGVVAYTATRWGNLIDPRFVPPAEPMPRASDCYRFALSHGAVDLCLAGPRNRVELDEALAALDRGPMDADELAWMKRVGKAVRARATSTPLSGARDRVDRLFTALTAR